MRGGTRVSYSMGFSGLDQKWGDMDMVLELQNMVLRGFTRQYLRVKPDLRMKQFKRIINQRGHNQDFTSTEKAGWAEK